MPTFLDLPENTPEWEAVRLRHIGGSEVAALFGVQADYAQSHYTLFMVKSRRIPAPPVDDEPGSRIWFGRRLEATIAVMAAELFGWNIEKGGYCIADGVEGMACSLDYIIREPGPAEIELRCTGPGVLQVKNADFLTHTRTWGAEPPFQYLLQLQHEIGCTGWSWGVVVVLVGGNELIAYRYDARHRIIDEIKIRVGHFWTDLREGKKPLVDGTKSTAEAIKALYPIHSIDAPVDLSGNNEIEEICAGHAVAKADLKGAETNFQTWDNRLKEVMKGGRRAITNNWKINGTYTPANPGRVAAPGEIVGRRKSSIWYRIEENVRL